MKKYFLLILTILLPFTSTNSQTIDREKTLIYNQGNIDFIESYLNLCLLIDSTIDKSKYHNEIDLLCKEVEKEIKGYRSSQELIARLNNYLFNKKGFKYNDTANKFFSGTKSEREELIKKGVSRIEFDLMPSVLKNRTGICTSLSMLYLTISYKLKLPLFGVVVPDHFFVRYYDKSNKINIETTNLGAQNNDDYYINKYMGINKGDIYLQNLNYEQVIGMYLQNIGVGLSEKKNYEKAIDCFNWAIEINQNYVENYFNRGNAFDDLKLFDKAIEDYSKAIELNSGNVSAYNNRGLVYDKIGSTDKAIADYTKAIEINPAYTIAYSNRGKSYAKKGMNDQAIEDYTKALNLKPDYAEAYSFRGITYAAKELFTNAINDFNKAIELNPDYAEAYSNRGRVHYVKGSNDKAIVDFTMAIEKDSNLAMAYCNRGVAWESCDSSLLAVQDFTKAIEINPNLYVAYFQRGTVFMDHKLYDRAIKDFTKAIKLNPRSYEIYFNRGGTYFKMEEFDKALKDFTKTIELNPNIGEAYFYRGVIIYNSGDKVAGCSEWKIALKKGFGEAKAIIDKFCK